MGPRSNYFPRVSRFGKDNSTARQSNPGSRGTTRLRPA